MRAIKTTDGQKYYIAARALPKNLIFKIFAQAVESALQPVLSLFFKEYKKNRLVPFFLNKEDQIPQGLVVNKGDALFPRYKRVASHVLSGDEIDVAECEVSGFNDPRSRIVDGVHQLTEKGQKRVQVLPEGRIRKDFVGLVCASNDF